MAYLHDNGTRYEDTGCQVAERCTECPLEHCRYDDPAGPQWFKERRAQQLAVLESLGPNAKIEVVAERLGVNVRSAYRIKAKLNDLFDA